MSEPNLDFLKEELTPGQEGLARRLAALEADYRGSGIGPSPHDVTEAHGPMRPLENPKPNGQLSGLGRFAIAVARKFGARR